MALWTIDMCAMPIRSEITKINTTKTKNDLNVQRSRSTCPARTSDKCKCNNKYGEYDEI
jgi:hypothetical protein